MGAGKGVSAVESEVLMLPSVISKGVRMNVSADKVGNTIGIAYNMAPQVGSDIDPAASQFKSHSSSSKQFNFVRQERTGFRNVSVVGYSGGRQAANGREKQKMFSKVTIALSAAIALSVVFPASAATKHRGAHVNRSTSISGQKPNEFPGRPSSTAPVRPDCWPKCV
jgi:hypothetical protein